MVIYYFNGVYGPKLNAYISTDDLNYINNMLKYPYQIVQPLTEQEDNDWDLEVGDNWDEKELKVGDYWFPSSIPKWNGVWYNYEDIPDAIRDGAWKILYIGPYKPEFRKPHYSGKNIMIIKNNNDDEKYVFAIDYFNGEYGPKLNAYIPTDNLNESDNDWDLEVGEEWNDSELSIGDVITPEMWDMDKIEVESDSIIRDKKWFRNPHKISKFRETRYVDIIEFDGKKELSRYFVEKWLKDNFKINFDGLNESDDVSGVEVLNVKFLG